MERAPPAAQAAALVAELGAPEAWQTATREAIDAHLAGNVFTRDHWQAVLSELARTAPRPGPGDLDVYRTAKLLIGQHGAQEAWRIVMAKAAAQPDDLYQQAISLRVADAISALERGRGG